MPLLTQEKAIAKYYEEVKDQYPDLSFDQISDICKAAFKFFRECINCGRLPIILIKHIGKFIVYPRKIKKKLDIEKRLLEDGIIDQERYDNNITFLKNYLKDLQDEYTRRSNLPIKKKKTID